MQIAIDGPAAAGKSTIAKVLARRLNYVYIDTGVMYRALTWRALKTGLLLEEGPDLLDLAHKTNIDFVYSGVAQVVRCDGVEVQEVIRSPRVSAQVSKLAALPGVRAIMVVKQQELAAGQDVVMDGRDIGEIVLPGADYKFFITADLVTRAERRYLELLERGYAIQEDEVAQELVERDRMDAVRPVGALKRLPDSIVIDTSQLSLNEVLERMLKEMGLS